MRGNPRKRQEQMFELLAYRGDGAFFSWYRCDANRLLNVEQQRRGPAGATWWATLHTRLEQAVSPPGFLDLPGLMDAPLAAELLSFEPGSAVVKLRHAGELAALCSLHQAVDPKGGTRFARLVKRTLPTWHEDALAEDLMTADSQAVMFVVQASGNESAAQWAQVYESALMMMAVYCRDECT